LESKNSEECVGGGELAGKSEIEKYLNILKNPVAMLHLAR
jgi:hypothetical protein